jgi:hypothetical protein
MIADGAPAPKDVTAAADEKKIARRLVLFVHGFDARGVKIGCPAPAKSPATRQRRQISDPWAPS